MDKLKQELEKNDASRNKIKTPKSSGRSKSVKNPAVNISRSKSKDVKVKAYKGALKSAKAIQKDASLNSAKAEQFIQDTKKYFKKNGELKKSVSNKQKRELNDIISKYKEHGTPTKSKVKKQQKKALDTARQRGTYSNKKEQNRLINTMNNPAVKGLIQKGMDSDQIVSLLKTFDHITASQFNKAAEYMLAKMESGVPEEAIQFLSQDDAYMALEEYLADSYGYNEDEDEEDIPFL